MTLFWHELRSNRKQLLLWAMCAGVCCFGCLLLFEGLEESMAEMADAYAQMGAFSAALGMDRLSVSTMEGFYATEVALIFSIGGAMFAAMTGAAIVAKEEEGHTSEFLNTLPVSRGYIIGGKYAAMAVLIGAFSLICCGWELAGFGLAQKPLPWKEFLLFHGAQLLMHLEVGSVCFLLSCLFRKKQIGAALGFAILLYLMDLMCRIVPGMEKLKYVTPYYFSNATDVFANGNVDVQMAAVSFLAAAASVPLAALIYSRRDLQA